MKASSLLPLASALALTLLAGCASGSGDDSQAPTDEGVTGWAPYGSRTGSVVVSSAGPGGSGLVWAKFVGNAPLQAARTIGPCQVVGAIIPTRAEDFPQPASAGTISVRAGASSVALSPDAHDDYAERPMGGLGLLPVTVQAQGGSAPGFTQTLAQPAPAQLLLPVLPRGPSAKLVLSAAHDFSLTWEGGSGSFVVFLGGDTSAGIGGATCTFDAKAHQGVIPAAVLREFTLSTTFTAYTSSAWTSEAQGWEVQVEVDRSAETPEGPAAYVDLEIR